MKFKINLIAVLGIVLLMNIAAAAIAVQLSDQGSNVKSKSTGTLLSSGSLIVTIYDAASGGNTVYNETFSTAISNGSWSVMLGENSSNPLTLEFGKAYYKDYTIAGEGVSFTNSTGGTTDRQIFYSPLGDIVNSTNVNQSANFTIFNLTLMGNVNATGIVYATGYNLSTGYMYATNGTYITWATANNGTLLNYSSALNGTLLQGSNVTYPYAINGSGWVANFSNFSIGWLYATNSTGGSDTFVANYSTFLTHIPWSIAYNGTLAKTDAVNTFGDFNQTFNGTTFFLWSLLNRIGIGTTAPQNTLNVVGDGNITGTLYVNGSNISIGSQYSTNGTFSVNSTIYTFVTDTNTTIKNYADANFVTLGGDTITGTYDFNGGWQSNGLTISEGSIYAQAGFFYNITSLAVNNLAINGSLLPQQGWNNTFDVGNGTYAWRNLYLGGDANIIGQVYSAGRNLTNAYDYALNDSLWTANYSTFLTHITWAAANNGTLLNYSSALNGTLLQGSNVTYAYSLNDSLWSLNYSNMSIGWLYATNSTGGGISWADAYNGTLAKTDAANTFGAFNQTFDTNTLFINANGDRVGILTTTPQNTLNVVGDGNVTGTLYVNGSNLSIGNQYATNGSFIGSSNVTYAYSLNATDTDTFVANYSTFLTHINWATANNGTLLNYSSALNGTLMLAANWNATNTSYYLNTNPSGFYNSTQQNINFNATNYFNITNQTATHFYINASNGRVGINTNTSQNTLNVLGDVNATGTVYSAVGNLSIGNQYATNGSFIGSANVTYAYSLNATDTDTFVANYSTFLTHITWATANNGTLLNYSNALNGSLIAGTNVTYAYSLNATDTDTFVANYSTFLTHITWANAVNGTLANTGVANTFGAFNQTFDTDLFFLYNNANFVGIGTALPQNRLNVVGDINGTGTIFANGSNLSIGNQYATNGSFIDSSNVTYPYSLNNSLWTANYSTFLTHITWATANNGTLLNYSSALNGTLARTNAANTFGAFNQTFDTDLFFLNNNANFVGIGTASPQNTLNVIGQINLTNTTGTGGLIWHNGTGLCIGSC